MLKNYSTALRSPWWLLAAWLACGCLGVRLYADATRVAMLKGFPPGSLILFGSLVAYSSAGRESGRALKKFVWILSCVAVWFLLYGRVLSVLRELTGHPTWELFHTYEFGSAEFVLFAFLWIFVLPDERFVQPPAPIRVLFIVRFALALLALIMGWVGVRHSFEILRRSSLPIMTEFRVFQSYLVYVACLLYSCLALRVLVPPTLSRIVIFLREQKSLRRLDQKGRVMRPLGQ